MGNIQSFTGLNTWKKGHELVIVIYKMTKNFPREEMFGLTNQLRRAAVSFTSNIAEGFSRRSSNEKARFYGIALGSLNEIQNQLLIARDIQYITQEQFHSIVPITIDASKLINGLLKSTKSS